MEEKMEEKMEERDLKREKVLGILSSIRGALITIAFIGGIIGISLLYSYLATEVWAPK